LAKLWRRIWQRTPPPSNALAVLINRFMCAGSLPHSTWSVRPQRGARGRGGDGAASEPKSPWHDALCLLGGSDVPRRRDQSLSRSWLPRPPLPAALAGIAGGGGAAVVVPSGGGDPNNVSCPKRGATAVANAMAFFARMDTFVHWWGEGCGNNGGGDVNALAACKSWQWRARREQEGGVGGRSDEAVVMLPRGGQATDDTTREGGGGGSGTRRAGDLLRPADSNECRFGYHCQRRAIDYCN
jgi:hypothetical protein